MKKAAIIFLVVICSVVHARIGETESQVQKRYGGPVDSAYKGKVKLYYFKGYAILVEFYKGKSIKESVMRKDHDKFSINEYHVLREGIAGVRKWDGKDYEQGNTIVSVTYKGDLKILSAKINNKVLYIWDGKFSDYIDGLEKTREKEKLKGF